MPGFGHLLGTQAHYHNNNYPSLRDFIRIWC
jgi:hypothetical protein